jgi:hypothetical protein
MMSQSWPTGQCCTTAMAVLLVKTAEKFIITFLIRGINYSKRKTNRKLKPVNFNSKRSSDCSFSTNFSLEQ